MGKILSLDYGLARIGVAISDEGRKYSFAREAIIVADTADVFMEIKNLIDTEEVDEVLIGLPIGLSGDYTEQTDKVKAWGAELAEAIKLPVKYWDERLSTQAAQHMVGKKKDGRVDSQAAQLILENYLTNQAKQ
ncbi:MAG: Holliday junction resolvase RuvX [Patescibacteria group bacterium]